MGPIGLEFQREKFTAKLAAELLPLMKAHYEEIAHFKDIPLDPDFEQYIALEQAGLFRAFIIRADGIAKIEGFEPGAIVGYAGFFVRKNIHYKGSLQASQDVIFVHEKFRHAGVGGEFINFCDEELQEEGVEAIYHHVKVAHNFGPLLKKLDYEEVDVIYGKRLNKGMH